MKGDATLEGMVAAVFGIEGVISGVAL